MCDQDKQFLNKPTTYATKITTRKILELEIFSRHHYKTPLADQRKIIAEQAKNVFQQANKLIKNYSLKQSEVISLKIIYNDTIINIDSLFFYCAQEFCWASTDIKNKFIKDSTLPFNSFIKITIQAETITSV
jgi:hypothetical protein